MRWEVVARAEEPVDGPVGRAVELDVPQAMISCTADVKIICPPCVRAHVCVLHVVIASRQFVHPGVNVHPIRMTTVVCN